MDRDRWQIVERVLDRALTSDPASWPTLLDDTCSRDAGLRDEVESLLAHRHAAERFLTSPPAVLEVLVRLCEAEGRQREAAKYRTLLEQPPP